MFFISKSLPWSCCTRSRGFVEIFVYLRIIFPLNSDFALNKVKHPGLHNTQPNTCSVVFCNQWPTAYSNCWYQTTGPRELMKYRKLILLIDN